MAAKTTRSQPVVAGMIAGLIGFGASFPVVLTGLQHVGATPAQARSGLLAVGVVMGLLSLSLSLRLRIPVTIAWSTPGAALLAGASFSGRFSDAVGGFLVCGLLTVLAGLVPAVTRLVQLVPRPVVEALLAGVLLSLALAPVTAVREQPGYTVPMLLAWLLCLRFARRWAAVAALVVAGIAVGLDPLPSRHVPLAPHPQFVSPTFTVAGVVSIGIPLFLVTMVGQNLTGVAVLESFGYTAPLRTGLVTTGVGTMAAAPFGGHAVNLAALTAALSAGPDAGPDTSRRWIAGVSSGITVIALSLASGLATSVAATAPTVVLEAVAGVALLGVVRTALAGAFGGRSNEAAAVTFLVAAAGVRFGVIGAPVAALAAGVVLTLVLRGR